MFFRKGVLGTKARGTSQIPSLAFPSKSLQQKGSEIINKFLFTSGPLGKLLSIAPSYVNMTYHTDRFETLTLKYLLLMSCSTIKKDNKMKQRCSY